MANWIEACKAGDIDEEDVIRFDHEGKTYAIYRSPDDDYFATDGLHPRADPPGRRPGHGQHH